LSSSTSKFSENTGPPGVCCAVDSGESAVVAAAEKLLQTGPPDSMRLGRRCRPPHRPSNAIAVVPPLSGTPLASHSLSLLVPFSEIVDAAAALFSSQTHHPPSVRYSLFCSCLYRRGAAGFTSLSPVPSQGFSPSGHPRLRRSILTYSRRCWTPLYGATPRLPQYSRSTGTPHYPERPQTHSLTRSLGYPHST
jgi:hypothetical protein